MKKEMTLDDVIELLKEQYERAKKLSFVLNPLAYALYQTWKIYDEQRGRKHE